MVEQGVAPIRAQVAYLQFMLVLLVTEQVVGNNAQQVPETSHHLSCGFGLAAAGSTAQHGNAQIFT